MTPIDLEKPDKAKPLQLPRLDLVKVDEAYALSLETAIRLHPNEDEVTNSLCLSLTERRLRELQEATPTLEKDGQRMEGRPDPSIDSFCSNDTSSHFDFGPNPDTQFVDVNTIEKSIADENNADENTTPLGFADQVLLDPVAPGRNAFEFSHFMNQLLYPPQHTAGKMTDNFQVEGEDSFSDFLSDDHWGFLKIPNRCDAEGRVVEWTTARLMEVEPYKEEARDQQGESGILDSTPATLQYLRMPMTGTPPPLDEGLHEIRRWYFTEELPYEDPSTFFPAAPAEVENSKKVEDEVPEKDDDQNSSIGDANENEHENPHDPYGYTAYLNNLDGQHVSSFDGPYGDGNDIGSREYDISSDAQSDSSLEFGSEPAMDEALVSLIARFHLSEPETYLRVVISTSEGLKVCFDMPKEILFTQTGKPVKKKPYNIDTGSRVCYTLITTYHITNVESFTFGLTDQPVFDIAWVQNNACPALLRICPVIQYYLDTQDLCQDSPYSVSREDLDILFHMLGNDLPRHYLLNRPLATPPGTLEERMANGSIMLVEETNLTVAEFIKRLYLESKLREHELRKVHERDHPDVPQPDIYAMEGTAAMVDDWHVAERVKVPDGFSHYRGDPFDLQQIDWDSKVGIDAGQARDARDERQMPFYNLDWEDTLANYLDETRNAACFVPKAMYTKHKASTPHVQLRNLMACKQFMEVVYAADTGPDRSKVFRYNPFHGTRDCIIDLSKTSNDTVYVEPVRISTVALSAGDQHRGICMVGGFDGEYAMHDMRPNAYEHTTIVGHATRASGGIINHIDIDYYAHGNEYKAVLACNDNKIRILDIETNNFLSNPGKIATSGELSGHTYPWAINCTAMAPDGKLRVVVGDTPDVAIVNAENGQCERLLQGHKDYGFACAWSPDGLIVATANQDRKVNIYDVRTWRTITSFDAEVAGYRSMKFSPAGGGARTLLLAEPADRVCVVNAKNYEECQIHRFYGQIVGADFIGDGTGFWVANADEKFGGMMEYERRGWGAKYGLDFTTKMEVEDNGDEWWPALKEGWNEWIPEEERMGDSRCMDPGRDGRAGSWMEQGLF